MGNGCRIRPGSVRPKNITRLPQYDGDYIFLGSIDGEWFVESELTDPTPAFALAAAAMIAAHIEEIYA